MAHRRRLAAALVVSAVLGGAAVALATPPGSNGRIAFTRYSGLVDASGTFGSIYTIAPNGTGERRLTRPPAGTVDFQPDWNRDGSRIAFERETPTKVSIWTMRPDGSDLQEVKVECPPGLPAGQICEANSPAWSPDGKQLAFGRAYGNLKTIRNDEWIEVGAVAVMDADGSNVRQLTQLKKPTSSEDGEPVWSPDGKRLAFPRLNSTAKPVDKHAIFVVNLDGTGLRRLTPWKLDAGDHPDWSPDGKRIIFRSPADEFDGSNVWTVGADGTGLRQLTHFGPSVQTLSSSYAPDGKWIVISRSGRGGTPDIFAIRPNGTGLRPITRTLRWDSSPDWGPR